LTAVAQSDPGPDNGAMENSDAADPSTESSAIDTAIDRIATRFPDIDRARIQSLVHESARSLDGARVRDFIPVLIEHEVMDRLRAEAAPVPVSEAGLGSTPVDDPRPGDPQRLDPQEVERKSERTGLLYGDLSNN
jgi:hypothetical protein